MDSIDLDNQATTGIGQLINDKNSDADVQAPMSDPSDQLSQASYAEHASSEEYELDDDPKASKKLSIVLSKEMHRRAKMQALKEDVTLRSFVVGLIAEHLRRAETP